VYSRHTADRHGNPGAQSLVGLRAKIEFLYPLVVWLNGNALVSIDAVYGTLGPVNTWMGDHLWADKPSWYVTNHLVNSAFYPSRVGKYGGLREPTGLADTYRSTGQHESGRISMTV